VQIDELRWFVAVVDDPNLTRAARALHLSQPALSRSLRRLEATLGVDLFDRVGRSVEPNEHGRMFAEHARRAVAAFDSGRDAVRGAAGTEEGEVRLAFLNTMGPRVVPELIGAYRRDHPRVRFRLSQAGAGTMLAELLDGSHDLLITSPRPGDERVAWRELFREPLRLAVPPDHRLAGRRRVRLAEVADDPFVVVRHEYGLRSTTEALCHAAGFEPQVAFEGEDVETLRGLVAAGLGVALLPELPQAPATPPLLAVADQGAVREIGLAWHRERYRSPAVVEFTRFAARRS
jgi:LysR family transcriptional regulator, transcription activator of glutamate synthase operon